MMFSICAIFCQSIFLTPSLTLSTQSLGGVDCVVSVAGDTDTGASDAEPPTTESEMGVYFKRQELERAKQELSKSEERSNRNLLRES